MVELKLRKLFRGYVFTDFDGNEIGCKDTNQAMDEIVRLLDPDKKSEELVVEGQVREKRERKTRKNAIETHRKIFEAAKEQINITGKINCAQIARDLDLNASNVGNHLKKMNDELEGIIKKWQDERDKPMVRADTRANDDGNVPSG